MVINEVARIEVPAQSRAIIQHYAGIDDMKAAVRRLQSRRDIQQMRLERLFHEGVPESIGFVRLYVAFEPLALELILARYDEGTDLLILSEDDVSHAFAALDLRLTERCMYMATVAAKPAFVEYQGRRYAVPHNRSEHYFAETTPNLRPYQPGDALFQETHRTEIKLERVGMQLPSARLMPYDEQIVRLTARKLRTSIERLELQHVVQ